MVFEEFDSPLSAMKIHKKDYKFVQKEPDKGFDADRNRRIVDEVIEETDRIQARKRRETSQRLEERTDAVSQYLYSISQGGHESNVMKYFGRKELMRLRGQEIMNEIQKDLTVVKDGKVIKRAGYATKE